MKESSKACVSTHERHRYVPPALQCGGARFAPRKENQFRLFQAATATCGTVIMNGLWCSKARSRWPTIIYFGLWVGGMKP